MTDEMQEELDALFGDKFFDGGEFDASLTISSGDRISCDGHIWTVQSVHDGYVKLLDRVADTEQVYPFKDLEGMLNDCQTLVLDRHQ